MLSSSGTASGHMQALVSPQALDPLAVGGPALPGEQDVDAAIAIAGMPAGQELEPGPELGLVGHMGSAVALGGPVLAHAPTRPALGHPEAGLQADHRPSTSLRGQNFPRATSLSMSMSSSLSASRRLSRAFSFSRALSRTTSSGRMALNW